MRSCVHMQVLWLGMWVNEYDVSMNEPEAYALSDEDFQESMNSTLEELAGVNALLADQ